LTRIGTLARVATAISAMSAAVSTRPVARTT
jgi:hypothetical protein